MERLRISLFTRLFLTVKYDLQMPDLLTQMLSIGRWRSVYVWLTHREAEREELPMEKSYKYAAMLLLKMCELVSAAVRVPQPDLLPCPKPVYSSDIL